MGEEIEFFKLQKGFYLIGFETEYSKTFTLGADKIRYDTYEEADKEREIEYMKTMGTDIVIHILELE